MDDILNKRQLSFRLLLNVYLIHEAAIGKIAGDQLNKLMTLGLSEKEAEAAIINGFLK